MTEQSNGWPRYFATSRRDFLRSFALLPALGAALRSHAAEAAAPGAGSAPPARAAVKFPTEITAFIVAKERQAGDLATKLNLEISTDIWALFAAAKKADWEGASKLWSSLQPPRPWPDDFKPQDGVHTPVWSTVLEVELVLEQFFKGEPKYATAYGRDIVKSIPAGSVYFGGTDPGRGLPTGFSKSHARGEPFFTLTQNALADGTYLAYLREMYGKSIYVPTEEDSQKCFQDYMADAQKRLQHDQDFPDEPRQVRPGEDIRKIEGRFQVSGQVAVMAINGRLTKIIFDQNPKREFYVEESFPLEWMYPYLAPHGLILKIHRQPLAALEPEILATDRAFWLAQTQGMIGDWLKPDTTVQEVCVFAEKFFGNKDLSGFKGDPLFVQNDYACKMYAKLRSSGPGVYAWRLGQTCPAEYRAKPGPAADGLKREAEFAFKQAYALCPCSPEALYRYVNLLVQHGRADEALLLARTSLSLEPSNPALPQLVRQLERMKKPER
jgi:hypothetical protein